MSSWRIAFVACAALLTWSAPSRAAEAVGEAVLIKTDVTGSSGPIAVKEAVHRDERIRTSKDGLGQFVFRDGSKLAVGWGSSVVIDQYVFDNSNSVKKLTVNAAKGTFRWISGKSKSSAYEIVTPAGTIGVRGTVFDFYVNPDGTTAMVLLSGAASFCGSNGCKQLTKKCDCVVGTPRGGVSDPARVSRATLASLGDQRALSFLTGNQQVSLGFGRLGPGCGLRAASLTGDPNRARQPARRSAPNAPAPQAPQSPQAPSPRAADPAPSAPTPDAPSPPDKPDKPDQPDKPDHHHHGKPHGHHGWGDRHDDGDGRKGSWNHGDRDGKRGRDGKRR